MKNALIFTPSEEQNSFIYYIINLLTLNTVRNHEELTKSINFTFSVEPEMSTVPMVFNAKLYIESFWPFSDEADMKKKTKKPISKKEKILKEMQLTQNQEWTEKKSDFNTLIPPSLYLSKNKLHGNLLDLTDTWTNYISVSGIMMQVKIKFKKKQQHSLPH